jgi:WD40 repeat protein
VQVPTIQPDLAKANPAMGVSQVTFSSSGRFLASLNESQSKAVWIWDVQALSLVWLLLHEKPVQALVWDPTHDKLAICTGSRRCAPPLPRLLLTVCSVICPVCE